MKATPFELVFGQPPRTTVFPGVTGHVMEEDVEDLLEEGIVCMYVRTLQVEVITFIIISWPLCVLYYEATSCIL